jgi:hypothetical protein
MALHRRSWTTKPDKALVAETIEKAEMLARSLLPWKIVRRLAYKLTYSSRQHGWVIHNEDGTKMIADR